MKENSKIGRVKDKINELEEYLDYLESITPEKFEDYKSKLTIKAACERYFEKVIGVCVDLAFLLIKEKGLKTPEDEENAFDILLGGEIIGKELTENLKDAKGMRNIIAHQYGKIDDEIVFDAISEKFVGDVKAFISSILDKL